MGCRRSRANACPPPTTPQNFHPARRHRERAPAHGHNRQHRDIRLKLSFILLSLRLQLLQQVTVALRGVFGIRQGYHVVQVLKVNSRAVSRHVRHLDVVARVDFQIPQCACVARDRAVGHRDVRSPEKADQRGAMLAKEYLRTDAQWRRVELEDDSVLADLCHLQRPGRCCRLHETGDGCTMLGDTMEE
jgi:hypothetical protein